MSEYCKVLIIDDEFIMRQGMKHMLEWEKEGFQIVGEASNGQEGLAQVEALEPHIVLADIVMPVLDGIEFSQIMGKKYPAVQLIILSSYDKFEYVKSTFINGAADYILKPTLNPEILLKTLKKAADRIPGMKLHTSGEIPYASQVEKVLLGFKEKLDEAVFGSFFPNTLYRLCAVNLRDVCQRNRTEMMEARAIVEAYYAETGAYVTLPVFMKEGILCVVINYRVKDEAIVIDDAQTIAGRLHRLYGRAFFVMSRSFSNMQEIKKYYRQDITAEIHNAFYNQSRSLFITGSFKEKTVVSRFEFERYTRYLSQGNYKEALGMFADYVSYLGNEKVEEEKMKNLTKNLLYNYLMEIEKFSVESEVLKERYFDNIENTYWIEEFRQVMEQIIREVSELTAKNLGMDDIRIAQIKKYVAVHYSEPLELSDIADKFQFSYTYLSSYFSQTAREGFSEYLNKIRIGHACQLLKQGELSIAEIGDRVGYSDHSYFCRVFKKITDETPSSYRRRTKQG